MCRSSIITYEDVHVFLGRVVWHRYLQFIGVKYQIELSK
jgi:hypothetical protein